ACHDRNVHGCRRSPGTAEISQCLSRLAALALLALGVLAVAPAAANAASETTNCAGLQAALDQAVNDDTITLNQLCNISNSGGPFPGTFSLSNGGSDSRSYTLAGQPGLGAGFDG